MRIRIGIPDSTLGVFTQTAIRLGAPTMISVGSLRRDNEFTKIGLAAWRTDAALDSSGFVAMKQGGYRFTVDEYVDFVVTNGGHEDRSGMPFPWAWWSSMDYCCEPEIAGTSEIVRERVDLTAKTLGDVLDCVDDWRNEGDNLTPDPMPILQGWKPEDYAYSYRQTVKVLERHGREIPDRFGVGSVCRRDVQGPNGLLRVCGMLHAILPEHVRLHFFGVKGTALPVLDLFGRRIESVDSMAWAFDARMSLKNQSRPRAACAAFMRDWYLTQRERLTCDNVPARTGSRCPPRPLFPSAPQPPPAAGSPISGIRPVASSVSQEERMGSIFEDLKYRDLKRFVRQDVEARPDQVGPWLTHATGIFPEGSLVLAATDGHRLIALRIPDALKPLVNDKLEQVIHPETFDRYGALPIEAALALLKPSDIVDRTKENTPPKLQHVLFNVDWKTSTTTLGELRDLGKEIFPYAWKKAVGFKYSGLVRFGIDGVWVKGVILRKGVNDTIEARRVTTTIEVPEPSVNTVYSNANDDVASFETQYIGEAITHLDGVRSTKVTLGQFHGMLLMHTENIATVAMARREVPSTFVPKVNNVLGVDLLQKRYSAPTPTTREGEAMVVGIPNTPYPKDLVPRFETRVRLANDPDFDRDAVEKYVPFERKPIMLLIQEEAASACRTMMYQSPTVHARSTCPNWERQEVDWKLWCGFAVEHGEQARAMRTWLTEVYAFVKAADRGEHWKSEALASLSKAITKVSA